MAAADPAAPSAPGSIRPAPGRQRSVLRTVALRVLAGLLISLLVLAVLGFGLVTRSFPTTDGEISLPGLDSRVLVTRDAAGIPRIEAETARDLFLAQGYVHAQDRFWEMDFRRHVTAGRLSELFGPSQLSTDTFIRTLGWRAVAEEEVAGLDETTLAYYQAYAEGVNAYLADRSPTEVSLEYAVLGLQSGPVAIEPWSPADSVAWLKAMAWDLRSNLEDEIERAIASTALDEAQMADVFPSYPYDSRPTIVDGVPGAGTASANSAPTTASASDADATEEPSEEDASGGTDGSPTGTALPRGLPELAERIRSLPALLGRSSDDLGSNSWVVAGELTESGAPLLANDPHLAPAMPSVWYQVGLRCRTVSPECPFDVSGFSFSGLPGVVIGHNQSIAWGMTNLGPDVADLVVERIQGDEVLGDDGNRSVAVREETIEIAQEEPQTITVRSTEHGPIVSDLDDTYRTVLDAAVSADSSSGPDPPGVDYALALEWTALRPGRTAAAIFALNAAGNWEEFRAAAELFDVPSQNLVYADVDGNIGYQAPGMIPRRGEADGMLPRQGWDPAQDWQGWIDFAQLPSVLNPERGWIVTANNPVTRPGEAVRLGDDFDPGDRAARITELLESAIADGPLTAEDFAAIQGDDRNPMADALVPRLLAVGADGDEDIARGQELLRNWDRRDAADSPGAAYFNVVTSTVLDEVFRPKLPEAIRPSGGSRWYLVIDRLLDQPDSPWWQGQGAANRDEALVRALGSAWTRTQELLGPEPAEWRWGELHALTIRNASLGESGIAVVERLFNRGPVEVSGGTGVVNATGWDAAEGFETNWVPSMRQIIDLGDFDDSRWINLTGASGHAFSPHYADQTDDWAANRTRPWAYSPAAVRETTVDTLVLSP